jgi:Effector-associated domain 1
MALSQNQRNSLLAAFESAFSSKQRLKEFMQIELDKNLDSISTADGLRSLLFNVIDDANTKGYYSELIFAVGESYPKNQEISAFVTSYAKEYWEKLDKKTELADIDEEKARLAIFDVQSKLVPIFDTIYAQSYSDEFSYLLKQILEKLNESNSPAANKVKIVISLIPGILQYEHELDVEKSLKVAFQPIRKLFQGK